mmetsp:Transcript_53494/g.95988  ORF Transcript_53494/g.95988 Transcript_53494/m.95988 type:complete len:249 (+) Transcript_53494:206-952(+)
MSLSGKSCCRNMKAMSDLSTFCKNVTTSTSTLGLSEPKRSKSLVRTLGNSTLALMLSWNSKMPEKSSRKRGRGRSSSRNRGKRSSRGKERRLEEKLKKKGRKGSWKSKEGKSRKDRKSRKDGEQHGSKSRKDGEPKRCSRSANVRLRGSKKKSGNAKPGSSKSANVSLCSLGASMPSALELQLLRILHSHPPSCRPHRQELQLLLILHFHPHLSRLHHQCQPPFTSHPPILSLQLHRSLNRQLLRSLS